MEGLESDPRICSNYSRETVEKTFPAIEALKGGNALFTVPDTPIKCAGASHFMYLADDVWRKVYSLLLSYYHLIGLIFARPLFDS